MSEQLPSRDYAEFAYGNPTEIKEQLNELEQIFEVMSPAELAHAMVSFISASASILERQYQYAHRKPDHFATTYRQFIATALELGQKVAIEQCVAARDIDKSDARDYGTIYDAARFEHAMLTDPDFHPVSIPVSYSKIHEVASKMN